MSVVLDASAVLAMLWNEPGAERVSEVFAGAKISAVNVAELTAKLVDRGAADHHAVGILESLSLNVIPFDKEQAIASGLLRRATRGLGLSLGDRACLTLARREGATALTIDRGWTRLEIGGVVEGIR